MTVTPDVSIVIVSWNTREHLARCLDAITAAADGLAVEVVVVDNASTDGTPAMLAAKHPAVSLIRNPGNLGFAVACNAGARASRARAILFLNSDCELEPGALVTLLDALDRDPALAGVLPRLANPDGTLQPSVHDGFPTPWSLLGDVLFLSSLRYAVYRRPRLARWLWRRDHAAHGRSRNVAWGGAAALLVRRQAFEQVGGFDERFFMYCEDMDLSKRLGDAGFTLRYVAEARAVHHWGRSAVQRPAAALSAPYRSRLHYFDTHVPGWGGPTAATLLSAELAIRRVLFRLLAIVPTAGRERFRRRAAETEACARDLEAAASAMAGPRNGDLAMLVALVLAWSLARYLHDLVKVLVTSDFIDFAHYYTFARIVARGLDPFDPGVVAAMDAELRIPRSPGGADYPPLFYLLVRPFTWLPVATGARLWVVAVQACLVAAVALVFSRVPAPSPARAAALLFVALSYQPLFEDLAVGQSNVILLLLVTLAWWSARGDRGWLAASALGLAVHVKPQYGLVVPLLWLARERRLAVRAAAAVALGFGVGLAALGPAPYLHWVEELLSPRGVQVVFAWNISGRAILHRVVTGLGGAPALATVLTVLLDAAVLVVVVVALRRPGASDRARDARWALAVTAVLLVTPMMEEHHLVLLLFPLAILLLAGGPRGPRDAAGAPALDTALVLGSILLLASRYSLVQFPSVQSGLLSLLLAGKLAGAGLLAAALVRRLAAASAAGAGDAGR